MDLQSRLLLNEDVVASMPEPKRSEQILSWLLNLDQLLVELQTVCYFYTIKILQFILDKLQCNCFLSLSFKQSEVKAYQKQLVDQLVRQIQQTPGPPARTLIGRALANLFSIGDPFLLFDTVNLCNEILKNRDDSPSYLPTKL